MRDEPAAVRERYARRPAAGAGVYSMLHPATWQTLQERQRVLLRLLARRGFTDLGSTRLLEVGCGNGGNLLEFLRMGCTGENITGLELLPERAERARRVLPAAARVLGGDALAADVDAGSQDIVFQAVVFSSLLDDDFQQKLADAMWRWVKPGGVLLWYDFVYDNPSNPDVRGVPLRRVRGLFPEGRIEARRVTLAPPIARRVCRIHPSLYTALNVLPFLRTHLLCWIEKP
ncbi:MAG: class I SAM-dependent methyltransferase [Proteobacteria bacterium]|nr:class I SAM-dependent methyltransferase [Pseudomonadota bacterium]